MTQSAALAPDKLSQRAVRGQFTSGMPLRMQEQGSAPVGFLFTALLSIVLFLMLIQVALTLYTKVVLVDAAGEGARVAGYLGSDLEAGIARTRALIQETDQDAAVTGRIFEAGGTQMIEIRIDASLPILGAFRLPGGLTAVGQGIVETLPEPVD